jgi:hypothetical protein
MWVRFIKNFDWDVPEFGNRVTLAFKAGELKFVKTQCGLDAIAKGAAIEASESEKDGSRKSLSPIRVRKAK